MNIDIDKIEKVIGGIATADEVKEFEKWLHQSSDNVQLYNRVKNYLNDDNELQDVTKQEIDTRWMGFKQQHKRKFNKSIGKTKIVMLRYISAAAAIVLVSLLVMQNKDDKATTKVSEVNKREEVKTIKAQNANLEEAGEIILSTENGSYKIEGQDIKNKISEIANVDVNANAISYSENIKPTVIENHTLIVPKEKEFTITLSDGTFVHLNANSKLIYPSSFAKNQERRVKLVGEAFFEVTPNKNAQFVVETEQTCVRVYGTKFNVNTHKKNVTEAVLVEGVVTMQNGNSKELKLAPNQLASCSGKGDILISDVDVTNYISWRNGIYSFYEETLENIMASISSWYGVEVQFNDEKIANMRFICNFPRYNTIEQVMNILTMSDNFSYKIVGNKIVISAR